MNDCGAVYHAAEWVELSTNPRSGLISRLGDRCRYGITAADIFMHDISNKV